MPDQLNALRGIFERRGAVPQFRKRESAGDMDQLPQGSVQELNAGAAQAAATAGQQPGLPAPGPGPTQVAAPKRYATDEDKFLFRRTDRPQEPLTALAARPLPAGIENWIPFLQQAANDPNATPWIREAFSRVMAQVRDQG